jgi:hypothetical protein
VTTEFLPADLVFTHGGAWLSRAIRWASRAKGEPSTYANHVGGFVGGGEVVEALWRTVQHPFTEMSGPLQVWRNRGLTDWDRARVATKARGYVGEAYGGAKIVTHLGDALLSKVFGGSPFFFRRLAHRDDYPICSWVWAWSFAEIGYSFGLPPEAAQPDDMHDWCAAHPDHWRMVYEVTA